MDFVSAVVAIVLGTFFTVVAVVAIAARRDFLGHVSLKDWVVMKIGITTPQPPAENNPPQKGLPSFRSLTCSSTDSVVLDGLLGTFQR